MLVPLLVLSLLSSSLFPAVNSQSVDCSPTQIQLFLGDDYYSVSQDPSVATNPSSNINTNQAYLVWHALVSSCTFAVQVTDPATTQTVLTASADYINDFTYDFSAAADTTNTGVYHTASYTSLLKKLSYEKAYEYTITDLVSGASEGPFRFTLPTPYLLPTSKKLFIAGDMDAYENGLETINAIKNLFVGKPDDYGAWIMMGDASYNVESDNGGRGDAYFQTIQSFNSRLPSIMVLGNHDKYANWSFINLRIRNPLFYKTQNHYFSYNYEGIHFTTVNFDFYGSSTADVQQQIFAWVENDLKVANSTENRAKWPWLVFLIHRPIYCSYEEQGNQNFPATSWCYDFYRQRMIWDELIHKYSVDLTIQAHKHSYERMLPLYQNKTAEFTKLDNDPLSHYIIDPKESVFIMEGSAGQNYYTPGPYSPKGYSVVTDVRPGYGVLYAQNNTDNLTLVYEHYSSGTGEKIDFVNIVKTRPGVTEGGSGWTLVIAIVIILVICGLVYLYWQKQKSEEEREMGRDDSKNVPLIELKR